MSSSAIMLINNLGVRENVANASTGLTIEQISTYGGKAWKDWLMKHHTDNYLNRNDRYEVMNTDPMATVWTKRFPKLVTAKPFKSYDTNIEGQPEEVMTDIWERWEELNMNDAYRDILQYCLWDGYCIPRFWLSPEMALSYHAYGYYHCPPEYWIRINSQQTAGHNKIMAYYISYFPKPLGDAYCPNHNMHSEDFYVYPNANIIRDGYQMFHFTRGAFNDGFGDPLGLSMWSTITKLRKVSWYDFKRSCTFPIVELPADMDPNDMESILDAWRNWDENNGMGLLKRINTNTGETEDYPRVYERTPDQTGATVKADPSSGGTLLRNAEYARALMITGNSEAFYVGSQPGELESSKINLTVDDRAIIGEFNMYSNIIKTLLKFLLELGGLQGCEEESLQRVMTGQFDIKCHLEWEVLENMMAAAEMAEEEASMKGDPAKQEAETHNAKVQADLLRAIRLNYSMPMTATMSSWIKGIGYNEDTNMMYMETHQGYKYRRPMVDVEQTYQDWTAAGSKGGYWWDFLADRNPAWERVGRIPLPKMGGYEGYQQESEEMRAYKTKILGPSRADFSMEDLGYNPLMGGQQVAEAGKAKPSEGGGEGRRRKKPRGSSPGGTAPAARAARVASLMPNLDTISYNRLNSILKEKFGQGMSKNAFTNLRMWMNHEKNSLRYNSISIGKPMDFEIDLHYIINGEKIKQKACKREFKLLERHSGDVVVYENQEHGGERTKIGQYDWYWDEELDSGMVKMNYDKALLLSLVPETSNIYKRIQAGLEPEMSTEYLADDLIANGITWQVNIRNVLGEKKLERIAIVNFGNCPSNVCEFTSLDELKKNMKKADLEHLLELEKILYKIGADMETDIDRDDKSEKIGIKIQSLAHEMYDILGDYKAAKWVRAEVRKRVKELAKKDCKWITKKDKDGNSYKVCIEDKE